MKKFIFTFLTIMLFFTESLTAQDFLKSHNQNRIEFTKSGSYKFTVLQVTTGHKSEYSICFEVSNSTNRPSNPCNKNATGTYSVDGVSIGNTLTIWSKTCGTCPSGEVDLTKKVWTNDTKSIAILTWESSDGFKLILQIEQIPSDEVIID